MLGTLFLSQNFNNPAEESSDMNQRLFSAQRMGGSFGQ